MMKFSAIEIRDILISMTVIAAIFAYLMGDRNISNVIIIFPITLITVGSGFVLHELGHKYAAINYGLLAEYRMMPEGILIAIISSMFDIILALPGAVYIQGENISEKENGIISLAGPLINIILALLFLLLTFINIPYIQTIGIVGSGINSYLALFNLLPIGPLDGGKILKWNAPIWLVSIAIAGILTFATYFN